MAENRANKRLWSSDSEQKERAAASKKSRTQDEYPCHKNCSMCSSSLPQSQTPVLVHPRTLNVAAATRSLRCSSVTEALIQSAPWLIKCMICCTTEELRRFWTKKSCSVGRAFLWPSRKPLRVPRLMYVYFLLDTQSVWCLKELQIMVDKYEMGKSKLIPIFYDVKPCDVRHLQGAFGQGFQKIIDKNKYSNQLIHKCKGILKISYHHLDTGLEKCLFLDVATFLLWEKEDLLVQLRQCNDEDGDSEVLYALDKLKMKNLIKVVDGVLMMHDLLVDLGRSIVKEKDSCPGSRSHVWHPPYVRYMLSNKMGSKKVKALNLVSQGSAVLDEDRCPWLAHAFKKLSSLEFLILQGYCIQG